MANDQTSPAADGLGPPDISGAIQGDAILGDAIQGDDKVNQEFVRPKSVRSARPFSNINTLDWNRRS